MALNPLLALSYLGDSRPKTQNESYSEKKIQHVIVVSIDTLRQDFLSCYGDPGGLSPQIDQLAEDGLLFQDAYSSSPWTLPSFSSIFTGVSPKVHKTLRENTRLPLELKILAECMEEAGYYTGAVGRNKFLTETYHFSQGYKDYNFFPKPSMGSSLGAKILRQLPLPGTFATDASSDKLADLASTWVEQNADHPFFLLVTLL